MKRNSQQGDDITVNIVKIKAEHVLRGDIVYGFGQVINVEHIHDVFENKVTGDIVGSDGVLLWFIHPETGEDVSRPFPGHVYIDMISTVKRA